MRIHTGLDNDAVPEAGAPMSFLTGFDNDAVPEAGAPFAQHLFVTHSRILTRSTDPCG
jgi:hypothetical protein